MDYKLFIHFIQKVKPLSNLYVSRKDNKDLNLRDSKLIPLDDQLINKGS